MNYFLRRNDFGFSENGTFWLMNGKVWSVSGMLNDLNGTVWYWNGAILVGIEYWILFNVLLDKRSPIWRRHHRRLQNLGLHSALWAGRDPHGIYLGTELFICYHSMVKGLFDSRFRSFVQAALLFIAVSEKKGNSSRNLYHNDFYHSPGKHFDLLSNEKSKQYLV